MATICWARTSVLGKEDAARHAAHLVMRAPEPLQTARDARRSGDLDHQIDRAHVDAQLERRGRDDARQRARLEPLLHHLTLFARDRAVMRERELLAGQLVDRGRELLAHPARVDEDHRRAVSADQLEQTSMQRGPDRSARVVCIGTSAVPFLGRSPPRLPSPLRSGWIAFQHHRSAALALVRAGLWWTLVFARQLRQVVDGNFDRQLDLLLATGIDDRDIARGPHFALHPTATEEPRHLIERTLRRREPDALQSSRAALGCPPERLEPFEGED
jgi:hypothetical protein